MITRQTLAAVFWVLARTVASAPGWAETHERRVALVIGNAAYQAPLPERIIMNNQPDPIEQPFVAAVPVGVGALVVLRVD
jgi:hypothetical protein